MATLGRNRAVLFALAAFVALAASQARAESISISILANGTTIDVDALTTGGTPTFYGNVDLVTLNALLTAAGSEYQFSALGGTSNFSGSPGSATLSLSGGINIPAFGTGSPALTITETEGGFLTPAGEPGIATSTTTGNWVTASPGDSHTAFSSFNNTDTPPITLFAPLGGTGPTGGSNSTPTTLVTAPYQLDNQISFSIAPGGANSPQDSFGVGVKLTVIPEPASGVLMSLGLPLSVIFLGLRKRYRAARAREA